MSTRKQSLRDVIGTYMVTLGERDDRVVIVNADLSGTCRNNRFVEKFPKRSFNMGIAEQNMASFAAGLANEGFIPYVFTMAPFISMRACEQVRTDIAYANLNVRMIAPYAGCSGGISGPTHWGMEDCAIFRSFPNMTIMEPCDENQVKKMLDYSLTAKGPIYIRNCVVPIQNIYDSNYSYNFGRANVVRSGGDGAYLCTGPVVQFALMAALKIEEEIGAKISVVDMQTIKPLDEDIVIKMSKTGRVVVAQDHNVIGGLGEAVATAVAKNGISVKLEILGIPDMFEPMAHADYLYNKFGYDVCGLEMKMMELLK